MLAKKKVRDVAEGIGVLVNAVYVWKGGYVIQPL